MKKMNHPNESDIVLLVFFFRLRKNLVKLQIKKLLDDTIFFLTFINNEMSISWNEKLFGYINVCIRENNNKEWFRWVYYRP